MYIIKRISKSSVVAMLIIFFMLLLLMLRLTAVSKSTTAYCEAVGKYSTAIDNELSVEGFLKQFDIEIDTSTKQAVNIIIPSEFNQVYENYNALQQSQGLDLNSYKGKEAVRYTYRVTNSTSNSEVSCNIIVCENKVIAGDLCTTALNGAMTALTDNTLK
ncbi:MAG: DUF4830 domain-containing protein [Acutalibacteraceae bacterium]|nr:DUF4830 domain-containing protein [Acutalibacteraceae bacterium]